MKLSEAVRRHRILVVPIVGLLVLSSAPCFAAMPWESPLQQLRDSFEGPTARLITVLAIIASGGALCVGESGSLFRRCAGVVFGASIMIGASSLASAIFG
jgi:type IV secretion system protein TrbC